ncbi:MAG: hypothetical protein JXB33_01510 [Clostridia bacterium]|nr:hypothetical protein [Clostridia bacterium]
MDKSAVYHLFVDYIDPSQHTLHSWKARIDYYTSINLIDWKPVGPAIDKGSYDYNTRQGDPDCYGAGSPDVLCTDSNIYIFYSGRGSLSPEETAVGLALPGQYGYVSSDIMYACAKADDNGAPAGPFMKKGLAVARKNNWETMRIDDPCLLPDNGMVHLYYKGFNDNGDRNNIRLGYACSEINRLDFKKTRNPVFSVPGGLEMPIVFKRGEVFNMFLRHFDKGTGTAWKHYISSDGLGWKLINPRLFDCAGPSPGEGATDMMIVRNFDGSFSNMMLACGLDEGYLKLWLYDAVEIDV